MSELTPSTTRLLEFKGHEKGVKVVAIFPDRRRMATGSYDKTLGVWDLETGVMVKKMEGHRKALSTVALSRDGQIIASGDGEGVLIVWNGETGETLTQPMQAHGFVLNSLDFSPDGLVLASGSWDSTTKFWSTKTWEPQGKAIESDGSYVHCVRYSPSGELLAIGTSDKITIYNSSTREPITSLKPHRGWSYLLVWTPDGTRLLSRGIQDATVYEWDALTWEEVGYPGRSGDTDNAGTYAALAVDHASWPPWPGDTDKAGTYSAHKASWPPWPPWPGDIDNADAYAALAVDPTGTLVASNANGSLYLWRLSDRQTVAIFQESAICAAFTLDGKHLLSGTHYNSTISKWAVPKGTLQDGAYSYINGIIFLFVISLSLHLLGYSPINTLPLQRHLILHEGALPRDITTASDTVFANRSKAKLGEKLWTEALLDAQKVIELNPSSHVGHELKLAALQGAQRYDEAITAFRMMFDRLESAHDVEMQNLRKQYASPSESESVIQSAIDQELDTAPLRLLNTVTGLLCDREAQISAFKTSAEHNVLWLSWSMKRADLRMEHITEAVATYFRCVMLSHRWEGKEPLLRDIQGKIVYELNSLGGIVKLQKLCEIARDAGYRWAWSDTCCIDKSSNVELQQSLNSMFVWYQHSALTIVYLSDVPPSSKSGALGKSEWNKRGWTFQEFLASKVLIFYQKDWTPYLNDHSPNHKMSTAIMEELEVATGIDRQALVNFSPRMSGARERLQWASNRVTTVQEDIAYSLFGVFNVRLPVDYGEKKANALGRLLQEIVARSGDITALDWVGQSSEFNSCLPADISSYAAPPCALPSLSEDEIQTEVSVLRTNTVAVDLALKIYALLESMSAPRFANRRLHLPCISFRVTEIRQKRGPAQESHFTYGVKADGLQDLLITTSETLIQFSRARPTRQTFFLVRPWDRGLFEQLDFGDDWRSVGDLSEFGSQSDSFDEFPGGPPVEEEHHSRALRMMVHLGQPFSAFLLAQQRVGEYKRIASDHSIIAQVKDIASVDNMDVSFIEIL